MPVTVLDVTGLSCPLPVLRAKKAIKEVPEGDMLQVMATDPGAVKDFEVFCRQTGNDLLSWREEDGVYIFEIRRN
ncbi:MAG: sulfurtransferase TusA family protein [Rhodospirillales bacterium]|nr:sulfurtransferase TusA family protein [Rhodospirillales bacterium]